MITPRFRLSQDDEYLLITIRVPYVKISDMEVLIDGTRFQFYLKPYNLDLNFKQRLIEDGRESARYDIDKGEVLCKVPKETAKEYFEDLDMIAQLLNPKKPKLAPPKIESLEGQEISQIQEELRHTIDYYGFNRAHHKFFKNLEEEKQEICDLDPDAYPVPMRTQMKESIEQDDLDVDRYLEDMDDEAAAEILETRFESLFRTYLPSLEELMSDMNLDVLIRLGNRSLLLNMNLEYKMLLQLMDIVMAFCYDYRSMNGETTCESAWVINKLSASLSCMVEFEQIQDVIRSEYRRILIYPIYRNYDLALACLSDTKGIFKQGKQAVLRVLLSIKTLFEHSEPRYLINRLFLDDMIIWLQNLEGSSFCEFQRELSEADSLPIENLGLKFNIK